MARDCLNLHSPISNEIKSCFIPEFPFVFFSRELSSHMFCHFLPVGLSFSYICSSSVFVLDINPLVVIPIANISSRSLGSFHLFIIMSFDVHAF